MEFNDSSTIYFYSHDDSAIISFINLDHHGQAGGGPYTFQTILTSEGEITFQYLHIPDSLYSATVGIQNKDGTLGMEAFCNQKGLKDSLVIKIRPGWAKVDSMQGWIQPGESKTLNLIFDPLTYPRGVYHADLIIESWDKNHQLETLIIPMTLGIDTTIDTATSVDWSESESPDKIALLQNSPNPFNPLTSIQYLVGGGSGKVAVGELRTADGGQFHTTLKIYNILGQKVRTLVDELKRPGNYEVVWDGKDDHGIEVASGIYLCKLTVDSYQKINKMVLLK